MYQRQNLIKWLVGVSSIVFIWLVWRLDIHQQVAEKAMKIARPRPASFETVVNSGDAVYTAAKAADLCDHYRLPVANHSLASTRKVYDLLLLNTEVDMLEVRMGQMAPYVDYFVILESDKTFTDHPKKLYVKENWQRYQKWHHKIILRTMDMEALAAESNWGREAASRNAMFTQVFPTLVGEQAPSLDDVLIVSDVDEIPKPEVLYAFRNCEIPVLNTVVSGVYYYSFQWRQLAEWQHPQATLYRGSDTQLPDALRHAQGAHEYHYGGWHCSYCFSTVAETAAKIGAFSHSEYNQPEFKAPEHIVNVARRGLDIFKRAGSDLFRLERNFDIPDYIKQNSDRFNYMITRDPPNANYKDYVAPVAE